MSLLPRVCARRCADSRSGFTTTSAPASSSARVCSSELALATTCSSRNRCFSVSVTSTLVATSLPIATTTES